MELKLSEAFRILESSEIIIINGFKCRFVGPDLFYFDPSIDGWTKSQISINDIVKLSTCKPLKDKVQYYKAFYREANCEKNDESSPDFTSKEHFLETVGMIESDFDFIQMIKIGEPV